MPAGETQKAYIAGIIDGEGCISVRCCEGRKRKTSRYYYSSVSVEMASKEIIDFIQELYEGKIYHRKSRNRTGVTDMTMWTWRLNGKEAANFLKTIYPFLVQKKKEAEVLIDFSETIMNNRKEGLKVTVIQKRDSLVNKLRSLRLHSTSLEILPLYA